ncbi:MAG TPA: hypothetical protein PLC26_07115 [Bacillota bacterium]|nr:hypothetical protein [Bacillota bacterium]
MPEKPLWQQTPWELACGSERVQKARAFVLEQVAGIQEQALRDATEKMLFDPIPLITSREPFASNRDTGVEKMRASLPYDPTWAAPGANLQSHHSYPGGWAIHTQLDLKSLLFFCEQAAVEGLTVNRDACVAAIVLHDWAKLKLMVWDAEHNLDADQGIGHHQIAIGEVMVRKFPPYVVQLLAGVHGGLWRDPEVVQDFILEAAHWIGIDPYAAGYLPLGAAEKSFEAWAVNQADATMWLKRRILLSLDDPLKRWYKKANNPYPFQQVRNVLYSKYNELELWQIYQSEGEDRLAAFLTDWFAKEGGCGR